MRRGRAVILISVLAALCAPLHAVAQAAGDDLDALMRRGVFSRDRNVAVQERPHPEWEARGLRVGALIAYPSLGVSAGSTDNLYATPDPRASDGIFHLRPSIVLQSQRPDRRLSAFAVVDSAIFASHPSEATTDYAGGATAAVETSGVLGVEAAASFARRTEPRTSPDSPPAASTPVRYDLAQGRLGLAAAFNRLRLSARAQVSAFDFSDVRSTTGATLSQDFRDRMEVAATFRGEYALRPAASIFAAAGFVGRSRSRRWCAR